jgi:hypothetical protein
MLFGDLRILRYGFFVPRKLILALFGHAPKLFQPKCFWLTNSTGRVGSLGFRATTCEYIVEHFGVDKRDLARAVFCYSFQLQMMVLSLTSMIDISSLYIPRV